jgi:hypothetical protein
MFFAFIHPHPTVYAAVTSTGFGARVAGSFTKLHGNLTAIDSDSGRRQKLEFPRGFFRIHEHFARRNIRSRGLENLLHYAKCRFKISISPLTPGADVQIKIQELDFDLLFPVSF